MSHKIQKTRISRCHNWYSINWKRASLEVQYFQDQIAVAAKESEPGKIRELQTLAVRKFSFRAMAVRKVTTNKGRNTVGIDGVKWDTAHKKFDAVLKLAELKNYKAKPVKRVFVPKKNGKERPLGIPTLFDRAVQALYHSVLDPVVETQSDSRSFGFRKGRSSQDAAQYIWLTTAMKYNKKRWVLEVDLEDFFGKISHDWLLVNVPMDRRILSQFLKAGILELGSLKASSSGVPQGGIISPCIANFTLNGLEEAIHKTTTVTVVRYADDFIIMGEDDNTLEGEVMKNLLAFLKVRGLKINWRKTQVTEIGKGFNFLGFKFREYASTSRAKERKKGIFLATPASTENLKERIRKVLKLRVNRTAYCIIIKLNPILRGWTEYYKTVSSKRAFLKVKNFLWLSIWRWCKNKHPFTNKKALASKYFTQVRHRKGKRTYVNNWVFFGNRPSNIIHKNKSSSSQLCLFQVSSVKIKRFRAIPVEDRFLRKRAVPKVIPNPYLIQDKDYFAGRSKSAFSRSSKISNLMLKLLMQQKFECPICEAELLVDDVMEIDHIRPKKEGGTDNFENLRVLHQCCHNQVTFNNRTSTKKSRKRP